MADRTGPMVAPRSAAADDSGGKAELLRMLAHELVHVFVHVLESDPALATRLRGIVGVIAGPTETLGPPKYMTVREYAVHARLSERTIRHFVKAQMNEGLHFHRDGREGRRVIIHPQEADAWRASRSFRKVEEQTVEELATNEVVRRRAQTALKKAGIR